MEANRQNHLAPNNKGLWRAVTKHFMSTSTSSGGVGSLASGTFTIPNPQAQGQLFSPQYTYTGAGSPWPTPPVVEIREEKYAVFYRERADKLTRNMVQGIILRDEETGAEIKMTLEELAVAAGMKW